MIYISRHCRFALIHVTFDNCRIIVVSRLGTGTSNFTYPSPLAWYSGNTVKDGNEIYGSTKSMRPYGGTYTDANDAIIAGMMTFSDTTFDATSDGGYFMGVINGASDKVDFINWFVEDFVSDPSLYAPVNTLFASLQVRYRSKFVGDTPVFSIKTACGSNYNPSLVFEMPMATGSDWTIVTITKDTPFSIYAANGWVDIDGNAGSVGTSYTYSEWKASSGTTISACFANNGYVAFGSGFNIGSGNSATTMYIDWIETSYYYNGTKTSFRKPV